MAPPERPEEMMRPPGVVDARHDRQPRTGARALLHEVLRGVGVGRKRVVLEDLPGDGVDPVRGDHVAREGIAEERAGDCRVGPRRERVVDRDELARAGAGLGEVADALAQGGHGHDQVVRAEVLRALHVHEEEGPVPGDGAAEREAVVVDVLEAAREAVALVGPAVGVELAAADVAVGAALEAVAAGAGGRGDDTASGAAELGGEPVGDHLELLHALERRRVVEVVGGAVALLGAIQHHRRRVGARAVDQGAGAGVAALHHTRGEAHQRIGVPADDRELEHLAAADHVAQRRALQLQLAGVRVDGDLGLHGSDGERQVHGRGQADPDRHHGDAGPLEPGQLGGDVVGARGQVGKRVVALPVGRGVARDLGAHPRRRDPRARNDGAGLVEDRARDGPLFDLGAGRAGEGQDHGYCEEG